MFESPGSKVVAIPFPFEPRTIQFGDSAKVLDFIAWKIAHMPKTNGKANGNNNRKTKEELAAMSPAEKKLYVLKRMLNAIDTADDDDIQRILEILDASNGDPA